MVKLCECGRPERARGMCTACYSRFRANGGAAILPRVPEGTPCVSCGQAERLKWSSYCRGCASEYERLRRNANAKSINAIRRASYDPETYRYKRVEYQYNLSTEKYKAMLESGCAICGRRDNLHVDHDHACCPESLRSCGKCVRGLLCSSCNLGLGRFKDSPELLESAAKYLRRSSWGGPCD